VIVYAEREEVVDAQEFRRRIEAASDPRERFILQGQFEAGIADAICVEFDQIVDLTKSIPERITIRPPEGYAYYALYPEMYADAASRFLREESPGSCVVVGIRSIGASLSAVVADAVNATWRFTVRPRGHPFHRELHLSESLENAIRRHAESWFLIVDEGPGLSGSSFVSVALKLEQLGIPSDRIVLFPSHNPDASRFVSEVARENWDRYKRYVEPFQPDRFVPAKARDISGGSWRELLYSDPSSYPAVHPQHERRKYLSNGLLWKFAGLGHYGRSRYERSQRLGQFGPRPCSLHDGFLVTEWLEGRPASLTCDLLDTMACYLAFLRAEFSTGKCVPGEALERMIEVNTGRRMEAPEEGVVVAGDGRMLPHEWIKTARGYVKADALDHHDDHFFPGCQDIAWDIAGASVEWGFPADALLDRYLRLQPDPKLRNRISFYVTAYRAYRIGYCTVAADSLVGATDGDRFRSLVEKYAAIETL
jgi:hypothetical protein